MSKKIRSVSASVESLFIGDEPEWGTEKEISLFRALSWYANQKDWGDSKKYTIDYAKHLKLNKDVVEKLSSSNEDLFKNLGFVCRMIQRGCSVDKKEWILSRIDAIITYDDDNKIVSQFSTPIKTEKTVQDRIYNICSSYISDIEDFVDQFIKTKVKIDFNPYDWMAANSIKSVHAKQIKDHFLPVQEELALVKAKSDLDLVEGYSNYTKKQLNEFHSLISLIIEDCDKIIGNSKVVRKARKKKVVSVDKKVAKIQYKKEDIEHKLVSISPTDIIGAKELWVYNTKYKQLGYYKSEDDSGFGVKGTTLVGFDEFLSIQKKLRKPLEVLDEFKKAKKADLKKFLLTIKTKEAKLTGRINSETILLKVTK